MLISFPAKARKRRDVAGQGKNITRCGSKTFVRLVKKCKQNEHAQWLEPIFSLLVVNLFGINSKSFPVLPNEECQPVYEGGQFSIIQSCERIKKVAQHNTYIRIEIDTAAKLQRKCGLYRLINHTRKQYPDVRTNSN